MKVSDEKKRIIRSYLLEKIAQGDPAVCKTAAEAFSMNQSTMHGYINQLAEEGAIERIRRGEYRLAEETHSFHLLRRDGELDSDCYALEKYLRPLLRGLPENVRSMWDYAFSEMMNNVIDHSGSEDVLITVRQNALQTAVDILDNGVGIFEKIRDHFHYETLNDAICELFKGKLTTDERNHSGEGIYFSSRMMDEFVIVSSQKVFTRNRFEESRLFDWESRTFHGTLVMMKLSNSSHRTPAEVFDSYADVDGGFTKTSIPLKNLFDTSPVSRSQAKRITNRLEKFEEVTLDFSGLDWMGQGFAHQIFAVFAREHPEIRLIPVNMSEAVEKMYVHVTKAE